MPTLDGYIPHPSYRLAMAQVVTRHGDRTAINLLPDEAGVQWDCSLRSRRAVGEEEGHGEEAQHEDGAYLIPKDHPYAADFWTGNCSNGQLTARGFEQQVSLGESLRQLYVHEHELLPKKLHAADVYVRSTDVPRTRESALGMLRGLYPPGARPRGEALRTWRKPLVIEDMVANALKCPRYEERKQEVLASDAFQERQANTLPLRRQLERVLHTQGEASFAADFDSYVDNLMTRSCHSKPLPCSRGDGECLTLDDARAVLDEGNWQYQFVYADEELNQLTSGHFLWDLTAAMAAMVAADRGAAGQETPYKLGVFGGHDTTVAPLIGLIAGGIPDGDWPPYATNVVLELWSPPEPDDESEGDRQEPVVRVLYNGVPTTVKGCAAVGVDDASVYQWCPFSQWQAIMGEYDPRKMTERCTARREPAAVHRAGAAERSASFAVASERCTGDVMSISTAGMVGMGSLVLMFTLVGILVYSAMALLLPKTSKAHRYA